MPELGLEFSIITCWVKFVDKIIFDITSGTIKVHTFTDSEIYFLDICLDYLVSLWLTIGLYFYMLCFRTWQRRCNAGLHCYRWWWLPSWLSLGSSRCSQRLPLCLIPGSISLPYTPSLFLLFPSLLFLLLHQLLKNIAIPGFQFIQNQCRII